MSSNSSCTVYIGNLDERVIDRFLYDILIQAGRVVDLYIPGDKESEKRKGFAFAEYESEEIADYAVRHFSGLVDTLQQNTEVCDIWARQTYSKWFHCNDNHIKFFSPTKALPFVNK